MQTTSIGSGAVVAARVIAVRFGDGPRWRRRLESRETHPACGQAAGLTIVIDTEGCSKWTPADVPALIERGYEAVLCNGARK